jgi:hypothetical protein
VESAFKVFLTFHLSRELGGEREEEEEEEEKGVNQHPKVTQWVSQSGDQG